ncbi:MAG: M3 family metallopeptidase [Bacteroidaceae bacterium]|nr:M3 family metallopeptidase [Bacteroidaceae bacterium]
MSNPFFKKFNTPHETYPFNEIKFEHYEEAFMEGMRREKERMERIINNPETPTFWNTIVIVEEEEDEYYDLLDNVETVFGNLMSAETNDEMEELAEKLQPLLTQHSNDISLNPKLFERIKYIYHNHEPLTDEEERLLKDTYEGFVRSGALLDEAGKDKLRALTEEAGLLGLKFSENLRKEKKAFVLHITDEKDLAGLKEHDIEMAKATAKEKKLDGWVFTLDGPSYGPFMSHADNRELRKQMYMAYNTLCIKDNEYNNLEICKRIVNIRLELANLLGYKSYADYVMVHRMAGTTKKVNEFLKTLKNAYKSAGFADAKEIREYARKRNKDRKFKLEPWDFSYYSHHLQKEKYNIESDMFRPYLKLENVIDGVFGLANRLYGITFKENPDIQVYHPDVKAYDVIDKDGSFLAVFYADFFPRDGKQGGAWMTEYNCQWISHKGVNHRPHVSVVMNFTKPTEDKPSLLTLGEVETFLHEFGHSLHGMFANTRFGAMSGTSVYWDFVELPSQIMENYTANRKFLNTFAFHYKTGKTVPATLLNRLKKTKHYLAAYSCMRQVSFGLLDMAFHSIKKPFDKEIMPFEHDAWKSALILPQVPGTCMTSQFSHIMAGGYSAGYYSYKWAEVLEADAFSVFKEKGIFNTEVAQSFRDNILSKGGTKDPMELYIAFRGKEPTIDALLKRNGIKPIKKANKPLKKTNKTTKKAK